MNSTILISALCLTALCASPAGAQDAATGATLYANHCATCHGIDHQGQGPMAPVLLVQPTDLTKLSEVNEGRFPTARIAYRIDGRDPLVSHGSDMPIFGWFFEGEDTAIKSEAGQPIITSKPVADLIAYLQGVQKSDF